MPLGRGHLPGGDRLFLCLSDSARRRRAAAAILLFLAGWFSVVGHESMVSHMLCPLHGELLEIEACDAPAAAIGPSIAGVQAASRGHGERDPHEAHNICTICLAGSERTTMLESAPACALDASAVATVAHAQRIVRFSAFPLYRLAPKQSPPMLIA